MLKCKYCGGSNFTIFTKSNASSITADMNTEKQEIVIDVKTKFNTDTIDEIYCKRCGKRISESDNFLIRTLIQEDYNSVKSKSNFKYKF